MCCTSGPPMPLFIPINHVEGRWGNAWHSNPSKGAKCEKLGIWVILSALVSPFGYRHRSRSGPFSGCKLGPCEGYLEHAHKDVALLLLTAANMC